MTHAFDRHLEESGDLEAAIARSARSESFEHRIVDFLISRFSLPASARREMYEMQRKADVPSQRLLLATFNELFGDFPFVIGAFLPEVNIHADPKSTEPARFRTFGRVPFVKAMIELSNAIHDLDNRDPCLVFPRRGFRMGMCMYQDDRQAYWNHGLAWMYRTNTTPHKVFSVRPFDSLITDIRKLKKWTPKETD